VLADMPRFDIHILLEDEPHLGSGGVKASACWASAAHRGHDSQRGFPRHRPEHPRPADLAQVGAPARRDLGLGALDAIRDAERTSSVSSRRGARIDVIAKRAKIWRDLLYHNYASKAAPFDEMVQQAISLREDLAMSDEAPGAR
jgi:hypothetical protein